MPQHAPKKSLASGLFHFLPVDRPGIEKIARQHGSRLLAVDLGHAGSRELVLHTLGQALAFPDWYGANFDALHDCLADEEWRGKCGSIVLISGLTTLRKTDPDAYTTLLEVLSSAAHIADAKHPLWLLLDAPAPGASPLPVA
ncbi:barstar family protein [Quatrionicoccus australiensis]|uniref:barstar family protein n=1 Tax=Quatrionicoccus australiensis TaxID=138118 RepID=UPI001CF9EB06|nr:barstar family protein [Quatrionicoccus australiensis]MCB4360713.1 barstar family protein [Quatrionicoccus australiensis]